MSLLSLYWAFFQIGLFSVGGGYAAIPLIREQTVVLHSWLSMEEFTNLVTIAEMTPGPIAVNSATFVGIRLAGLTGAVTATAGCITPSLVIVTALAAAYQKWHGLTAMQSVLSCLRPAVVALIASAGLSLLQTGLWHGAAVSLSGTDWQNLLLFIAAFAAIRWGKINPILAMLLCGAAGTVIYAVSLLSGIG